MNYSHKPNSPILLFIGCTLIGLVVFVMMAGIVSIPQITKGIHNVMEFPRKTILSIQMIQMVGLFILPPVLFALFSKSDFLSLFHLNKTFHTKKYLYATILAISLFPILINLQYLITQLPLPEHIKLLAEQQNLAIEEMTSLFLKSTDWTNFLMMILIMGIGAGLTEELFFRGALMPLVFDKINNQWFAMLFTATLFALVHQSIYNFVPILIVGALFGFIYFKTWDLKLNIFIHALYNSFQVLLNYLFQIKVIDLNMDEVKFYPLYIVLPCILISAFMTKLIIKNENISN